MLDVKLLGRFDVNVDGRQVELTSRPAQLLFIYLILNSGMPMRREKIAGTMWPESSGKNARDNLRHALWRLRKTLEEAGADLECIKADDETIRFEHGDDSQVDIATLDQNRHQEADSEDLTQSLEVYAGDLLPGFYEDWITRERDRLRAVYEAQLVKLIDRLQRAGQWTRVIEWGERWIALGGAPEPAYRALMTAHGRLNDLSSVAAVYQRCINSLGEQLGIEPSEETRDLYDRIMAGGESIGAPSPPGQPFVERPVRGYELKGLLGRGRFGAVYRAQQPVVGRDVAVKIILPEYADDPDFIRRFAVEAQVIARLEHPHIVPLYDYWREPGGAYVVMRWLRGGSLERALKRGPWHLEAAMRLLRQVAAALDVAHRQGVIHRDVKPANILLDDSGNAYLTDFGVAALVGPLAGMERPVLLAEADGTTGSLGYVSPEGLQQGRVTEAADIYSLGVVMYETLTAEHPFPNCSGQELIQKHLHEPLPEVRARRPELPPIVDAVIQRATAKDPGERYADLLEMTADLQGAGVLGPRPLPASVDSSQVRNPYKGLRPFEEADAGDFFGRRSLVERLLDRMWEKGEGDRFLALVGPSGSGKSSTIAAGLLPVLRQGGVRGSEGWYIARMVPGQYPLDELELALLRVAAGQPAGLMEHLRRDERGLIRAADLALPDPEGELLLVIDQFEEIFTLAAEKGEVDRLLQLLTGAVTAPRSRVRALISLRADFYDRPLVHREFGCLIQVRTEVVVPMGAEEMSQAISEPAARVGLQVEPELITAIVSDVGEQPGALPLLQFALTELFERREGRRLTLAAYQDMGGVLGALGRTAEQIYQDLGESEQDAARQVFLRLVRLGEGVEDTRRRVLRSELEAPWPIADEDNGEPGSTAPLDSVLQTFGECRLLTFDRDPATRGPTVEVAHEALLRKWNRLRRWLDEARDDIRQERAVSRLAEDWDQHGRDGSYLLRGAQLAGIETWSETSTLIQTPLVQEFISQSLKQRARERQAEAGRLERERELERRSQIFLRVLVAVFALAAFVSVGLALVAREERLAAVESAGDAQNVALVAGSRAALASSDTETALALAWQAVALNPDSAIAQAQLSQAAYTPGTVRVLEGNEDIVSWIDISPDDKSLLAGSDDGSVILWDLATGEVLWKQQPSGEWVQDVGFSPDGRIAAATYDDRIMLWSAADGQIIREIESPVYRQNIAFHPSGEQFATIGSEADSRLVIWDLASGEARLEFDHGIEIEDIRYTEDGSAILIAGKDGVLTLVDAQSGSAIDEFEAGLGPSGGALRFAALSPDGYRVAAALSSSGLIVWDLGKEDAPQHFRQTGDVYAFAFHPHDGTVLIGGQGVIRRINPNTGEVLANNTSTRSAILDLAITSDGRHAVTTALDQTVRLWDLRQGQVVRRFAGPSVLLYEADLSPDGKTALAGMTDGSVTLWDVGTGEQIWRFRDDQPILAVTFSPDGREVLVGAGYRLAQKVESGHVILLDGKSGEEIRRFEGQPYATFDVEFSPDGRMAASAGNGAMAILWDVRSGEEIRRFEHEDYWVDSEWAHESYWDVKFSPDGGRLFASHASGPIIGWDLESGEQVAQLEGHGGGAAGIVFSQDGGRLASGGTDSQVILWDIETGDILHRFTDHSGAAGQVELSPDQRMLLGSASDGSSSLWSLERGEAIRRYGGGFVFSPHFSADGRYALVGHRDGAVEMWHIDATIEELITWTQDNRFIPDLTCEQREFYGIEPLCAPDP